MRGHGLRPSGIPRSGPYSARLLLDGPLVRVIRSNSRPIRQAKGACEPVAPLFIGVRNEGRSAMTIASVMKAPEAVDHAALAETDAAR